MLKIFAVLCALVLAGCDVPIENHASADGYSTAKRHIEGGGCSMQSMEHQLWSLKVHGYSKEYIARFAGSYKDTCDEHVRKAERFREACAGGTSLVSCASPKDDDKLLRQGNRRIGSTLKRATHVALSFFEKQFSQYQISNPSPAAPCIHPPPRIRRKAKEKCADRARGRRPRRRARESASGRVSIKALYSV